MLSIVYTSIKSEVMKFIIKFNHHPLKKDIAELNKILKHYHVRSVAAFDNDKLVQVEVDESGFQELHSALPNGIEIYKEHLYKIPTTNKCISNSSN